MGRRRKTKSTEYRINQLPLTRSQRLGIEDTARQNLLDTIKNSSVSDYTDIFNDGHVDSYLAENRIKTIGEAIAHVEKILNTFTITHAKDYFGKEIINKLTKSLTKVGYIPYILSFKTHSDYSLGNNMNKAEVNGLFSHKGKKATEIISILPQTLYDLLKIRAEFVREGKNHKLVNEINILMTIIGLEKTKKKDLSTFT